MYATNAEATGAKQFERELRTMLVTSMQSAKRYVKIVAGFTLLVLGVVMIFTPGPGWFTVLAGLALLAAEYVWARRLLDRLHEEGARLQMVLLDRPAPLEPQATAPQQN
jgi:uncharacterized protein (TIGR02611 family)